MRTLDLFAGIGGFALAGHWMGWETAAFVEWDPFCQKVLAKNFPDVPIYGDINQFSYEQEKERIGTVDLVCGGFPCQPVSIAGKRKGKDDERWGWTAMFRVIRESKPAWVVGENVAGLLTMDGGALFEEICADLESEGYAVQAFRIPAIAKGAPHRRDRVWIVAKNVNPADAKGPRLSQPGQTGRQGVSAESGAGVDDRLKQPDSDAAADARDPRLQGSQQPGTPEQGTGTPRPATEPDSDAPADAEGRRWGMGPTENFGPTAGDVNAFIDTPCVLDWNTHWLDVALATCHVRMDDGLPPQLDELGSRDNRAKRLKALGNAIVPQVVYEIFQAIEKEQKP